MTLTPDPDCVDDYRWLEEIDSDASHRWIVPHNEQSQQSFLNNPRAEKAYDRALTILEANDRIAWPVMRGQWCYNFWRDSDHPRGLWRRAQWSQWSHELRSGREISWEVLLDIDELARTEDENWVYSGAVVHRPSDDRALLRLSRGGADAVVLREYDLSRKCLIPADDGGFWLDETKCSATWLDPDSLLLAAPLGTDDRTDSGYARTVRLWTRGQDPAQAPVVFSGESDDVAVGAGCDRLSGRVLANQAVDFHRAETWYWPLGTDLITTPPRRIALPSDCRLDSHNQWLILHPRSDLHLAGRSFAAGSVLALPWSAIDGMSAGDDPQVAAESLPEPSVLFTPRHGSTVTDIAWCHTRVLLSIVEGMTSRLEALAIPDPATDPRSPAPVWDESPLTGLPNDVTIELLSTDPLSQPGDPANPPADTALCAVSGPLTPPALVHINSAGQAHTLAQSPHRFTTAGMSISHHMATSEDGTSVPYTVLRGPGPDGPRPTIMYAYGGFEIAMRPSYAALRGALWLEHGGAYVIAGIRGGGEYGPQWHEAARRERRPRAFDDCAAVARDLVSRGVCTVETLGAAGGSNGGLLMGVMLTRYPQLFAGLSIAVPLFDMRRFHLLLAGASWVAEYGDPDSADWDNFLRDYSPYHQIRPATEVSYPPALITTSTRDDRVHPGHARKAAARLEEAGHTVYYYENIEGGHGGAADNSQEARKNVMMYEFFRQQLGLD